MNPAARYGDGDELVVVDHKTDAWRSVTELDAKVQRDAVRHRS
jgi:hypothetical protein